MKIKSVLIITALLFTISSTFVSCKSDDDDDDNNNTPAPEFIADNSTFASFMSWPLEASHQGPDPALGTAHGGNDSSVTRNVHFKNGQDPVNGVYPLGTVIVKHSANPGGTLNEFTAMVKRGNNFNPGVGNWEFFMLESNGTIAVDGNGNPMRGANLMNGLCGGCHTGAANKDFIFSK